MRLGYTTALVAGLLLAGNSAASDPSPPTLDAFLASDGGLTPASAAAAAHRCNDAATRATSALNALETRAVPATLQDDFVAYDTLKRFASDVKSDSYVLSVTQPDPAIRGAGEACMNRLNGILSAIELSRTVHDRLATIPRDGLDADARNAIERTLAAFRRNGVDRDAAARTRIADLRQRIEDVGFNQFEKNIHNANPQAILTQEDVEDLPEPWRKAHLPAADGLIHISLDEAGPAMFSPRRETRRKVFLASNNTAYPENRALLEQLLQMRHALAQAHGDADFASYVTTGRMLNTPQKVADFLDASAAALKPAVTAEYAQMLAFAKQSDPSLRQLHDYDYFYYTEQMKARQLGLDQREIGQYFRYEATRAGIFRLMGGLFGVEFQRWETPVWAEGVTAWEMREAGRLVGRFYLDPHPREGKHTLGLTTTLRTGIRDGQIPVALLMLNLPEQAPIGHRGATVFLHEFGHLLQALFSGEVRYAALSVQALPQDFQEGPSQLWEEWAWDYDTLKDFASNEHGAPIPEALVRKMNQARHFGSAVREAYELASAAASLDFHHRPPGFDMKANWDGWFTRYLPGFAGADPGEHGYAGFIYFGGPYAATYYNYPWSRAIALDLFSRFKAEGLHNPTVARRYRDAVLAPGGSREPSSMIEDFLGRPLSLDAYRQRLSGTEAGQ